MTTQIQNRITTIVCALATIVLTLISDFLLGLPREITWLTFFVGSIVTIAITLLEQRLLDSTSEEINRKLTIYPILESIEDPELRRLGHQAVAECLQKLRDYQAGFISSDIDSRTISTQRLDRCMKSFSATFWPALRPITDFEDTFLGRNYYAANVAAATRGVNVERIFILNQEDTFDEGGGFRDGRTLSILQRMAADGIHVRITWIAEVEKASNSQTLFRNFAIFDDQEVLAIRHSIGNTRQGSALIKNPGDVHEYENVFQNLRLLSMPLDQITRKP